ncbi:AAA family ATPase [Cereibacter johrii]|uniref:ATP-binding protein involved in virulence n=1 Tax=Cereibacter johrii TaxID=445629 RepID=A0ABX5J562_9RHOB|nr:AAA family ATPase [Cereibacter johrii]ODM43086.1 hypothetical protein A9O63_11520 [Cereibacter johrii]PTM75885.1 putative ATP-binding protein involved in virulence [Cereibacter johrii]
MEEVQLRNFSVSELFGEYNYEIPINLEKRVTAIIAPNGSGKTLCLRLIAAFFSRKWTLMLGVQFTKLTYTFSDECKITISKRHTDNAEPARAENRKSLEIRLHDASGKVKAKWIPKVITDRRQASIERYLPFLSRVGDARWRHDRTGDIYDLQEAVEAFGDSLPESIRTGLWGDIHPDILAYSKAIDCRLIETQRLLVISDEIEERYYKPRHEQRSKLAINEKAKSLKNIISSEINSYAAFSQTLDRSFPRRVILEGGQSNHVDLTSKLIELDAKRKELMSAGILNSEVDDPVALPTGTLDPAVARVLQMYAVDTQKKLETLDPLLSRINLFKKLISQRFSTKTVSVDRDHGIFVKAQSGEIPVDKLSSGEQHQLVLFFELLFEIQKNSLILIDEPELSLHVAWQKKFVADLINIIELNSFDVVLATHSPQLISHWEDIVVELGDVFGVGDRSE